MQGLKYVDVDYCRFENLGYQKPTRFYGGKQVEQLENVLCDKLHCPALVWDRVPTPGRPVPHINHMGGGTGRVITEQACYIPPGVLEYVAGLSPTPPPWPPSLPDKGTKVVGGTRENSVEEDERLLTLLSDPKMAKAIEEVRVMRVSTTPRVSVIAGTPDPLDDEEVDFEIASRIVEEEAKVSGVKTGIEGPELIRTELADEYRQALFKEFGDSSLSGIYPGTHIRGPDGEAEIWLQPGAKPVSRPAYSIKDRERREALIKLVDQCIQQGKLEHGKSAWNTPCFPVPKKTPGSYRLVQDLRAPNAVTIKDGHPLPIIVDMVQRQAQNLVWTTLDLVDGYHQMPMKKRAPPHHLHGHPQRGNAMDMSGHGAQKCGVPIPKNDGMGLT